MTKAFHKATPAAAEATRAFLGTLPSPVPFVSGDNEDGIVNLYWNHDGGIVDLGFDRDGIRSYFAILPDKTEFLEDDGKADDPLPPAMHAYLNTRTA